VANSGIDCSGELYPKNQGEEKPQVGIEGNLGSVENLLGGGSIIVGRKILKRCRRPGKRREVKRMIEEKGGYRQFRSKKTN